MSCIKCFRLNRRSFTLHLRLVIFLALTLIISNAQAFGVQQQDYIQLTDESILSNCPGEAENPIIHIYTQQYHDQVRHDIFRLKCFASYEIQWDFVGNKPNDIYIHKRIVVDHIFNTTKKCYESSLSSYKWSPEILGRTGLYTCSSKSNVSKSSSKYHFSEGKYSDEEAAPKVLFSAPSTVTVYVNSRRDDSLLVIPCAANILGLNATIWAVSSNGTIGKLKDWISQSYDTTIGFLLRNSKDVESNDSLAGNYLCRATYDDVVNDIEIKVLELPAFRATPEATTVTPTSGEIFLACEADEPVEINLANLKGKIYSDLSGAEKNKSSNYNYSSRITLAVNENGDVSGEAHCVTTNQKRVLHSWKFDSKHFCQCTWKFDEKLQQTEKLSTTEEDPTSIIVDTYDYVASEDYAYRPESLRPSQYHTVNIKSQSDDEVYFNPPKLEGQLICSNQNFPDVSFSMQHCGNDNECHLKSSCPLSDVCPFLDQSKSVKVIRNGSEETVSLLKSSLQSGILRCNVNGSVSTMKVDVSLDNMYFNRVPSGAKLIDIIAPERNYVAGDKLLFSCLADKNQFAHDLAWAIVFKNGSIGLIDLKSMDDKIGTDLHRIYRTSYIHLPSSDISALLCLAPVWSTNSYKNYSLALFNQDYGPTTLKEECSEDMNVPIMILHRFSSNAPRRERATTIVNNKTVIMELPVDRIKLVCRSKVPTQWLHNDELIVSSKNEWSNCGNTSSIQKGKWYDNTLEFKQLRIGDSGKYTCRKPSNYSVQSSVYLFTSGNNTNAIVEEGEHITVVKPLGDPDPWAKFPCRTSHPNKIPYFFRDREESDSPQLLELGEHLKYEATKGFLLDISSLTSIHEETYFYCAKTNQSYSYSVLYTLHRPDDPMVQSIKGEHRGLADDAYFTTVIVLLVVSASVLIVGIMHVYNRILETRDSPLILGATEMAVQP